MNPSIECNAQNRAPENQDSSHNQGQSSGRHSRERKRGQIALTGTQHHSPSGEHKRKPEEIAQEKWNSNLEV
jgi:hypothetical protein